MLINPFYESIYDLKKKKKLYFFFSQNKFKLLVKKNNYEICFLLFSNVFFQTS